MRPEYVDNPVNFSEALEEVNAAPSLRKIKTYLDKLDMSADMKAILYDISAFSIKVGQTTIAVGRRVFELATGFITKFPNFTLSTAVAVVIGLALNTALGGLPVIGALASFFSKLLILLGMAKGAIDDICANASQKEVERISAQFDALGLGVVKL